MRFVRTERFRKDYRALDPPRRERVRTALERYAENPSQPAPRVKKMEGAPDVWEMRVSDGDRIPFQRLDGGVLLRGAGAHDILRRP